MRHGGKISDDDSVDSQTGMLGPLILDDGHGNVIDTSRVPIGRSGGNSSGNNGLASKSTNDPSMPLAHGRGGLVGRRGGDGGGGGDGFDSNATGMERLRQRCSFLVHAFTRKKTVAMIQAEIEQQRQAAPVTDSPRTVRFGHVERDGQSDDEEADGRHRRVVPAPSPSPGSPGGPNDGALKRVLTIWDLISYGVGSTVGAGVFVITGVAASDNAGPALVFSFLFAAVACLFSGLCYCEFSTRLPVTGSAYTYAYATLGELVGFIIGWNLTLEYGISASAVARGWAGYVGAALDNLGVSYPRWLVAIDAGFTSCSLLSVLIIVGCTLLLCYGVKESAKFNLGMTVLNITIIMFVIISGAFYVDRRNWSPFFPYGVSGMFHGSAKVFFSYIGFDTVSGLAEEVKRPQRDLPIGIAGTLGISAALYSGVSLVITGMVPYFALDKNAPLSQAFKVNGVHWAADIVAIGSVTTLTATTLCSLLGQPRIFLRMSKDGLFYKNFSRIHPKYNTPVFGTIVTGLVSALLAFFLDIDTLADMISIGTLLAFNMVCVGVLVLRYPTSSNGKLPSRLIALVVFGSLFTGCLYIAGVPNWLYMTVGCVLCVPATVRMAFLHQDAPADTFRTPFVPFFPVLGLLINTYLLFQLTIDALLRLLVWTAIGLGIYLTYGIKNSGLNSRSTMKQYFYDSF